MRWVQRGSALRYTFYLQIIHTAAGSATLIAKIIPTHLEQFPIVTRDEASAAGHKDTTTPLHLTQYSKVKGNGTLQGLRLQLKPYMRMLQMQGHTLAS